MNEEQTQEGQQQWDSWLSRALQGKGLFLHGLRPIDVEKSIDLLQRTMDVPPGGTRWSNRARTGGDPISILSYSECAQRALLTYIRLSRPPRHPAGKTARSTEVGVALRNQESMGLFGSWPSVEDQRPCGTCCDESTSQESESCVGCPERKVEAYAAAGINGGDSLSFASQLLQLLCSLLVALCLGQALVHLPAAVYAASYTDESSWAGNALPLLASLLAYPG
eukprot:s3226_g5.t1